LGFSTINLHTFLEEARKGNDGGGKSFQVRSGVCVVVKDSWQGGETEQPTQTEKQANNQFKQRSKQTTNSNREASKQPTQTEKQAKNQLKQRSKQTTNSNREASKKPTQTGGRLPAQAPERSTRPAVSHHSQARGGENRERQP
jgi:hypothetical protein